MATKKVKSTVFFVAKSKNPKMVIEFLENHGIKEDSYFLDQDKSNPRHFFLKNPDKEGLSSDLLDRIFRLTREDQKTFPKGFYPQISDKGKRKACERYLGPKSSITQFTPELYLEALGAKETTRAYLKKFFGLRGDGFDGNLKALYLPSNVLNLLISTTHLTEKQLKAMTLPQLVNKLPWRPELFQELTPRDFPWKPSQRFPGKPSVDTFTPHFLVC